MQHDGAAACSHPIIIQEEEAYLVVLQRILHGERLDELLRTDKTQSVLKAKGQSCQLRKENV